jgi:hypothetical protein
MPCAGLAHAPQHREISGRFSHGYSGDDPPGSGTVHSFMLRQAEIDLSKGKTSAEVCRTIDVHEQTYYRWRKEFGGMAVDLSILKEVSRGHF